MVDGSFREKVDFARGTERAVEAWLKSRGWYVLPTYDYTGLAQEKAPKLHGAAASLVIPDLDICRNGVRRWAEVKYKTQSTFHRITARPEHGFNLRLLNDYRLVQEQSGCEVWIIVIEAANETAPGVVEATEVLLGNSLPKLGKPRIYEGGKMGRGGMAYWPRESFRAFGSWAALGLASWEAAA